eukprot:GEMP01102339.1.p1 GENE.GEMP01102339.1~~GEMP01102339.1.p1  ORF type:complete len:114 (-),score=12.33 GEMP01102339.1:116-457(-)
MNILQCLHLRVLELGIYLPQLPTTALSGLTILLADHIKFCLRRRLNIGHHIRQVVGFQGVYSRYLFVHLFVLRAFVAIFSSMFGLLQPPRADRVWCLCRPLLHVRGRWGAFAR